MELKPVRTDDQRFGRQPEYHAYSAEAPADSADAQKVLRNTYLLLAATMVPTVLGAFIGIQMTPVMMASPFITLGLMLASLFGLQFAIVRYRNSGLGVALLLLLTGLMGVFIGPLLNVALSMRNGMQIVSYAALGTGGIFFAMAGLATTTKRDFGFLGKFLFVGMWALFFAAIANMFFQIPALALTISTLVIVVFSLFLLYDLNRIVRGGETNYVMATTGVYLSLLNIFTSLIQLLLALTGQKD